MRREGALERRVCDKALALHGVASIKLEPPKGSHTGWPDRMFLIPGGCPFLLEFKEVGFKPEPIQEYIHDEVLGKLGYDIAWTDNEEAALEAIAARVQRAKSRISKARN